MRLEDFYFMMRRFKVGVSACDYAANVDVCLVVSNQPVTQPATKRKSGMKSVPFESVPLSY